MFLWNIIPMPRRARIDTPGALQHIIIRGIERSNIFRDEKDKNVFLKRFGKVLLETSTPCYAWTLMDNHAHLLLRTGLTPLFTVMQRLLTGYAHYYNRRHQRHGQLFQNRYKSVLCEEDPYFLELIRYIHLNPVRAKVLKSLKELNEYRFSGHMVLIGKRDKEWQDRDYVLGNFGTTEIDAINAYKKFVRKGFNQGSRAELTGGGLIRSAGGWTALKALRSTNTRMKGDERILGSGEFVENTLKQANEQLEKRTRYQMKGITFETLIEKVANYFDVVPSELSTNSKVASISRARIVLCYLCVRVYGYSCAEVARRLNITPSTVSKAIKRANTIEHQELMETIKE
jgi:REP-associated tyrosine transposase